MELPRTPLKLKRDRVAPSECTPTKPKRPRYFGHSPSGSPRQVTVSFSHFKDEAYSVNKILKLILMYGVNTVTQMKGVLSTIPVAFPRRLEFCEKICSCIPELATVTTNELKEVLLTLDNLQVQSSSVTNLLWNASEKFQQPLLVFMVPNVQYCLIKNCDGRLYGRKEEISEFTLFSLTGPLPGLKASLTCSSCGARYGLQKYRPRGGDAHVYPKEFSCDLVEASNKVFFSEDTFEFMCESGNHGFVSAQGFSQIYQSVFHADHSSVKKFLKLINTEDSTKPTEDTNEENDVYSKQQLNPFMTRKSCTEAFFNGELEREIRQRKMELSLTMREDSNREDVMKKIDEMRRTELYPHTAEECNEICRGRGCQNLRVIDSCWKLCIPHCMLAVHTKVEGSTLLTFPNVCTDEPKPGSVFCEKHHEVLVHHNIPTNKKEFLAHIGCRDNPQTQDEIRRVDQQVLTFMADLEQKDSTVTSIGTSAVQYQGTQTIVDKIPDTVLHGEVAMTCNKDTGEKGRLRQRARGHFAAVTGGGNILCFNPIYKSESPSQIFMLTVQMIYNELKDVPEDQQEDRLKDYILSYDNMCNLDKLKAAEEDLPLPGHLSKTWKLIRKIIDRLHLKNHKDKLCQIKYNPEKVLREEERNVNTMAAEQLFAWMSRFKKIVNSMTQTHHLFYLHRMCQRRNRYSALCRKRGVEPVHPGVNVKFVS